MTALAPKPDPVPPAWGRPLTELDYSALIASWITRELANQAMLRRVDDHEGREVVSHKGKRDCSGILIPYYWPGNSLPVAYRVRRDRPEVVQGINGELKPSGRYLGAPGEGNRLYIPPGITQEQLADINIPIVIVEGEKKALALWRLANYESNQPRFIPVAIAGVWNWRGTVGKTGGPNGERMDVKGPIADLGRLQWDGRTAFIIFDANVHTNEGVRCARKGIARELTTRGAKTKLVNLPGDCGVNGVDDLLNAWGPTRVLELIDQATDGGSLHVVMSPQFESRSTGMYRITRRGEQLQQTQLTNYQASIEANVLLDDGAEVRREFEIRAELLGNHFSFTVPASGFPKMDWAIEQMGPAAITFPNQREYARTAIQSGSLEAIERHVYTHTGWCNVRGQRLYLHAGGAIGGAGAVPGMEVRLTGALSRYEFPFGTSDLPGAVRASLRLARLGPPSICFPLLAATFRAVFGDADFALHLAGETGAFKSEVAALHQQHFGAGMDRLHLPGAWASTGNALEVLAFHAKDAFLVIDDFAPQGNAADIARYHAAADRIFRAVGNHAGRGRLDSTARLREAKPPRGLILSTGEDIPRGHSIRARLLVLELAKGSISPCDLTACQTDAHSGLYAQTMGAFIQWIAHRYEEIRAAFVGRVSELRLDALQNATHARTPEIIANLQAAFGFFLEFGASCGAIGRGERDRLANDCWEALRQAAAAQANHQAATEPTARFLDLVRGCLSSGRAHLRSREGTIPDRSPGACGWHVINNGGGTAHGDCIGWVEDDAIYLEPTAAYRVVQTAGREMGDQLAVTELTLKKRLHEKGLLASTDEKRQTLTIRRSIAGSSKQVLHFRRDTILPESAEDYLEEVR